MRIYAFSIITTGSCVLLYNMLRECTFSKAVSLVKFSVSVCTKKVIFLGQTK